MVRVCYATETLAWAMVVLFGVSIRLSTLEADFPNRQMALNGELLFTGWAGLMMLLAVVGLYRARGLLFRESVASGVASVTRLFTLVPMTAAMLTSRGKSIRLVPGKPRRQWVLLPWGSKLLDEVGACIQELQDAGTLSSGAQPVIVAVRERSCNRNWF